MFESRQVALQGKKSGHFLPSCFVSVHNGRFFCTIIIVLFVVRLITFFAQEGIPWRLNLAHSKLLSETCRRLAVEAQRLSNWLHQKSTPI
jgi:hypothetical protein